MAVAKTFYSGDPRLKTGVQCNSVRDLLLGSLVGDSCGNVWNLHTKLVINYIVMWCLSFLKYKDRV